MSFTPKQKNLIKAAKAGMNDNEYLFFELLQEVNESLQALLAKESPPFPEMPVIPEVDMSETNELLRKLLAKEDKEQDVKVSLKIV